MNLASRARSFLAASFALLGLAAGLSQAQTTVSVNGAACSNATVTLGAGSISISTAGCAGTAASPPTISGLSVSSGLPGDPVTINGANLIGASVTIGGISASVSSNSGTQIFTSVPAGATGGGVVVNTGVAPNASAAFTVNAAPTVPPTISSLSVTSGTPGTALTISGTNLAGASVTIGSATASVSSNNGLQITTTVPGSAVVGVGTVIVTTAVSPPASSAFTVLAPPPPTISSVSPSTGGAGTTVTISGTNLIGASVTIGGAPAGVITSSATSITTSVPASAPVAAGNLVVTTSTGTATIAFNVTVPPPPGDISVDGLTLPNPSKSAFIIPPIHPGFNGAGGEVNAHAMTPTRCNTTPALTRSWQHNIDLADYKGKNAFDFFVMSAGEALSYKFTVGNVDMSGGFIYNDAANAVVRPTFITITSVPCDFDVSKVIVGVTRDACYQTGLNGNSVNWANITGALSASYCRLTKGATYYMNIRFQDARPTSLGGSPTSDSCTSGNCGGIIQVL